MGVCIEEANDELAELENPYDTSERNAKKVNYNGITRTTTGNTMFILGWFRF